MRLPERLPPWARSIRFRLTLLYSAVVFGIAALLVGALYLGLSLKLREEPFTQQLAVRGLYQAPDGSLHEMRPVIISDIRAFERAVNRRALDDLATFSFAGLGVLFIVSLGVGWVISGRVLAPIDSITDVARRIGATDLSRRIHLKGPDDELKKLADTFDAMLARLDTSFRSQRRFVADASHELRNPLAIIQTSLDVALDDERASPSERRRATDAIRRATTRMNRLVDDLLVLARREGAEQARAVTDLCTVVEEVSEEFGARADEAGIDVTVTCTAAEANVDPDAIRRAVANLVDNAIRFSAPGSTVKVSAGAQGAWTWAAVTDEGLGIPEENHGAVFQRFWRADPSRSRAEGGTGLGLAIVKETAEAHGGGVSLFSTPGSGATFVVWLPGIRGPVPGAAPRNNPVEHARPLD
jgi:signal transduction histidine kinase